jgi:predicted GIY-YIG superfamily endonuclease
MMHALYRFYNACDELLYVGITNNPAARFRQHADAKDWWAEVATIRIEQHGSREALMDAERQAIKAEQPAYNVVHNDPSVIRKSRPHGLKVGAFVAVGMVDGRCPVGEVVALDESWLTIRGKDWLTGLYCLPERALRLVDISEVFFADRGRDGVVLDHHLADIQAFVKCRGAVR